MKEARHLHAHNFLVIGQEKIKEKNQKPGRKPIQSAPHTKLIVSTILLDQCTNIGELHQDLSENKFRIDIAQYANISNEESNSTC